MSIGGLRQWRPQPTWRVLIVTLAMVLGTSGAAVTIGNSAGPGAPMTLVAEFDDASPLVIGNQVKVAGVEVGTVAKIAATDHNTAAVTLHLDESVQPLHQDATATIRPVTILGERFVDLDRGTPSAPLLSPGAVLPVEQTRQATDLDEVLNMINRPTGEGLAALLTTLGHGMQGRGSDADAAIRVLESSMRDTDRLVKILGEQNALLAGLVDKVQPVAAALAADQGRALDRLMSASQRVLKSTSRQEHALEATLSELPATLTQARETLRQVTGTAGATTPALRGMRPTTDNLAAMSRELREFSRSADPALASAAPMLHRAERLMDQARPVVTQLRKAGPDLKGVARAARPLVTGLAGNMDNVLNFFRYWAMATNGWDGLSHYFRGMVIINPEQLTGLLPQTGGPTSDSRPPEKAAIPPWSRIPNNVGGVSGLLDDTKPQSEDGGVTGLNRQQESNALEYLLGGS